MLTSSQSPSSTPVTTDAPLSAIGRADASAPVAGTGSNYSASNNSGFMGKMKIQYILGGLLVALIAIGSGVGFWLSQTSQDVRQQAAVDDGYNQCVGDTPVRCSCGGCGATQAQCNSQCSSVRCSADTDCSPGNRCAAGVCIYDAGNQACSSTNHSGTCPAGNRCVSGVCIFEAPTPTPNNACSPSNLSGACPNGFTCGNNGTCISTGSGACSASNPTGTCGIQGQRCVAGICITPTNEPPTPTPGTGGSVACSPSNLNGFCPSGYTCGPLGTCVITARNDGDSCTANSQCPSNQCVAGVCNGCGGNNQFPCSSTGGSTVCDPGFVRQNGNGVCVPGATCPTGSSAVSGSTTLCSCTTSGGTSVTFGTGGALPAQCSGPFVPECPAGSTPLSGSTTVCTCNLTSASGSMSFARGGSLPTQCSGVSSCSPTVPNGSCPAGQTCTSGECRVDANNNSTCGGENQTACANTTCDTGYRLVETAPGVNRCQLQSGVGYTCSKSHQNGTCPAGQFCDAGVCNFNNAITNATCGAEGQPLCCSNVIPGAQLCSTGWTSCDIGFFVYENPITHDKTCQKPTSAKGDNYCITAGQCIAYNVCTAKDVTDQSGPTGGASCQPNEGGACAGGTTCGPSGRLLVCRNGVFTWTQDDGYCGGAQATDDCGPGSDQWCSNGKEVGDTCNPFNGVGGVCLASDINPNPYITVYGACTCAGAGTRVDCCVNSQTMGLTVNQCVAMGGSIGACGTIAQNPNLCAPGFTKMSNGTCVHTPTGTGGTSPVDVCQNGTCSSPSEGCIAIHYCSQLWPDGTCVNDVPQVTEGSVNAQQVANQTCMCVQVDVLNGENNSCVNGHINGDYSTLLGAAIVCPNVACATPTPTPPTPGASPTPIAQVTPTPSVPPTLPPPGPVCLGITRNGPVSVGNPVTFTCSPVAGISNYQARIRVNDGAFTNLTMNGSTTANYTIPSAGLYTVQCRICTGAADSTCQAWEPV
jgi:hypothetical protein